MVAHYRTQAGFARKLGKSRNYINDLLTGDRSATPMFLDLLIETFHIQDPLRTDLYRTAAIDYGYRINISSR